MTSAPPTNFPSVNEIEICEANLVVDEELPSKLDKVLGEVFKEVEGQHQDSRCEHSDSDNSDAVNTNHSRPFPNRTGPHHCVSLNYICLSHQRKFIGDFFWQYNSTEGQYIAAKMQKKQSRFNKHFSPNKSLLNF